MVDQADMPRFRTHVRRDKGGKERTYYYWDGRGAKRADVSLGSNYETAIQLWQRCEAGIFPKRRLAGPKKRTTGKRRRITSPAWADLPAWARPAYLNAERRALQMGRPFTITADDFATVIARAAGVCEVSGIPFDPIGKRAPFSPSIDRIECARGYEPGNVRLVCLIVNVALGAWGEAPLRKLAEHLCGTAKRNIAEHVAIG